MHRSLQIYRERTYWKMQPVVLGGIPRQHRFFVRLVSLIFIRYFCMFGCGWISRLLLILRSPKLHTTYLTYSSNNYMYLVQVN